MRQAFFFLLVAVRVGAQDAPLSPFQEQKARSLLRNQLSCLGCHELRGDGGRSAPSLTAVASRRNAAYIRAIIEDPQRVAPGVAMPESRMPSTTRELLIRFFTRGGTTGASGTVANRVAPTVFKNAQPDAASLYAHWCASCHGPRGKGDGPNARYLPVPPAVHASAERMRTRSDDALFDAIAGGGAIMGKSARMPAFGATLSSPEIRALVAYIRRLCTCRGPAWSRSDEPR